ncbi:DUF4148 domain-containing protein [Paraburkholderia sp. J67]|uniref:DUF4148 domain-containing protein n=1 Tax=Paraburkholderia sp. J67 TaxID=2805435 RepID=UPI002ABD15AB|nr:DUF4148 domain-containing protein [Paraburkholderia sp. J67]
MSTRIKIISLLLLAGTGMTLTAQAQEQALTRAQVRADLIRLEQAGYSPSLNDDATYPAAIQAAEAKVSAEDAAQQSASSQQQNMDSGTGPSMTGTSDAGHSKKGTSPTTTCVGPASYCTIYFGS